MTRVAVRSESDGGCGVRCQVTVGRGRTGPVRARPCRCLATGTGSGSFKLSLRSYPDATGTVTVDHLTSLQVVYSYYLQP